MRRTAKLIADNPSLPLGQAMIKAGYSPATAIAPQNITQSASWAQLMEEYLPEADLLQTHKALMKSQRLDHMVFPLETKDLTDDDIRESLSEVNCTVRRIAHGETARHVYFWCPDNRARKDGLEMAYKLRGSFAPEKHEHSVFALDGLHRDMIDGNPHVVEVREKEKDEILEIEP